MTEYRKVNGLELRVCKVIKHLPESGRYLVELGDWDYDPRGHSVLIEWDDESIAEASVVAITGYRAGIVIVR